MGLFIRALLQAVVKPEPFFSHIPTVQNIFLSVNIIEKDKIIKKAQALSTTQLIHKEHTSVQLQFTEYH